MGGLGSGRSAYATTPTVRECLSLNVNRLKEALTAPGRLYTVQWGEGDADPPVIRLLTIGNDAADTDHATAVRLSYTVYEKPEGDRTHCDTRVPVEWQECHFGGERPWWRCPRCRTRRGKLYCPPNGWHYQCRECHDLGYATARASRDGVATARLRFSRIHQKLTGEPAPPHRLDSDGFPEKPAGMSWLTYLGWLVELRGAHQEWSGALYSRTQKIAEEAGLDAPESDSIGA
jgi:hypothetical protein